MMKSILFYLCILVSVSLSSNVAAKQESETFSDAELAQMLAPIALYPDSLLTHILIASTYPLEIVEAHRWLKKNSNINTEQMSKLTEGFDWDASVKALVRFDHVLSRLSDDLSWTQSLGDAFLQDEERLLQSIQALRQQANIAGSLNKMDTMDISYEDNNIAIVPTEREVVYVPYYDSRMVYGAWSWVGYPPVYWQSHHHAHVSHYNPFYWHTGVRITFNYFFSAFHWHNRHVVVVNPHGSHHGSQHRYYHQRPHHLVVNGGYAKRWTHKPAHRKGVAYRTKKTSKKYHSKRIAAHGTHKQLNSSHHQFKQRLHRVKHSPSKVAHQPKPTVKAKVQHNKHQSKPLAKNASHRKLNSTNSHKDNKTAKVSRPTTKKQSKSNKGGVSKTQKKQQSSTSKRTAQITASTRGFHGNKEKNMR